MIIFDICCNCSPVDQTGYEKVKFGFRVSTHAVYNNHQEIDVMFDRLVEALDATGRIQVSGFRIII